MQYFRPLFLQFQVGDLREGFNNLHKADKLVFSKCEATAGSVLFDEAYICQYLPVDGSSNQQGCSKQRVT